MIADILWIYPTYFILIFFHSLSRTARINDATNKSGSAGIGVISLNWTG